MPALAFIAVCLIFGRLILARAVGPAAVWWSGMQKTTGKPMSYSGLLPAQLAAWSGALWIGLISVTWLIYILAYAFNQILPSASHHPLLFANIAALAIAAIVSWLMIKQRKKHSNKITSNQIKHIWKQTRHEAAGSSGEFFHLLSDKTERLQNFYILSVLVLLIIFSIWLMYGSFYIKQGNLAAGYSIFSDFAPHTAIVSSFSEGRNWPTCFIFCAAILLFWVCRSTAR